MVWKKRLFFGFLSFVRVPPYESWANWTNFYFSWENGDISFSRKSCNLFHTKNEEKSQKISTLVRISTCVYANTWQGGHIVPPPPWIGLTNRSHSKKVVSWYASELFCFVLFTTTGCDPKTLLEIVQVVSWYASELGLEIAWFWKHCRWKKTTFLKNSDPKKEKKDDFHVGEFGINPAVKTREVGFGCPNRV